MTVAINKAKICVWILGALGIVILLVGIIALSLLPGVYKKKVHENIVLQSGKETFEKWKITPIPVSFTVYLFNCTNSEEVQKYGEKPILEEAGPYVFRQQRSKEILEWDEKNHTITYKDMKSFYFVPELSADQDQKLYTLNMPLMGIMNRVRSSYFKDLLLDALDKLFVTYKEKLFTYRSPRELLFGGYRVDMVADLLKLVRQFVPMPDVLPNNTFGYFYDKNNTGNGILTVYTGADDITKYSQIVKWNNRRRVDHWKSDKYCGMINGTDGSQFAPPVTKYETLYVFTPEICRSARLEFVEEVFVKNILAYRFMAPDDLLASENPDNRCFCLKDKMCNISGIIDISSCSEGLPIFVSGPHFYKGHKASVHAVQGMSPDEEVHETFVDIEPITGVVLRASRKFQLNYLLETYDGLPQTRNAPNVLFPLMWITEEAEIDGGLAYAFTAKVKTPATVARSVLTACIVLGILWIILAGLVTVYIISKQKKKTKKPYQALPLKPEENGEKSEKFSHVNT